MAEKQGRTRGSRRPRTPRITADDEKFLKFVAAYDRADTESDLILEVFQKGLAISVAEIAAIGKDLPDDVSEQQIAVRVGRFVAACAPLLHRVGVLERLGLSRGASPRRAESDQAPV